ncbi:MAG: SMC-Scp complex subunit ScpB [Promethearchaeota archaeon]|nr:MAG: SMC-Scp complex subunit ScpB [Candidatus Lokiarchaeota archaeon]
MEGELEEGMEGELEEGMEGELEEGMEGELEEGMEGELEEGEETEEERKAREEREMHDLHRNQIEAALYAAGRAIDIEELSSKLNIKKSEVEELVTELAFDYLERSTALVIAKVGERFQMQVKSEYTEDVSSFASGGAIAEKYLRTLTIIALKQPILKSTLVKIRGSGAYEHVKYLEENELVGSVKKGRTSELTTTDRYAEMFGLPKDKDQMKRVMIAQLGIDESDNKEEIEDEPDEEDYPEDQEYPENQDYQE